MIASEARDLVSQLNEIGACERRLEDSRVAGDDLAVDTLELVVKTLRSTLEDKLADIRSRGAS